MSGLNHLERVRIERLLAAGASISGIAIAPEVKKLLADNRS
jgi:hypothetical protein